VWVGGGWGEVGRLEVDYLNMCGRGVISAGETRGRLKQGEGYVVIRTRRLANKDEMKGCMMYVLVVIIVMQRQMGREEGLL
jgi:hypothetical protein